MKGYIVAIDITPDIVEGYDKQDKLESGRVTIEMQIEDTTTVNEFCEAMFSMKQVNVKLEE